jgi:methyltransferase (TIGR00027 family)
MGKTGESYQQALRHVRAEGGAPDAGAERQKVEQRERSRTVADTAFSIAVVRAEEAARPAEERLFEDPYAAAFAAAGAHAAESTQRFLELPFFRDGIRLRTRFIDDAVRDALAAGLDQVVLMGAGFDARGLRMPEIRARGAKVYEIDTPEQLARKREVLRAAAVRLPAHDIYVPFDFDQPDFDTALAAALDARGFRTGGGAVFVWEGVIGYVDEETIHRSLSLMARAGGPGSRVVFTYIEKSFDLESAEVRTARAGFRSCDEIAGDDLWRRYLPGEPYPTAFVMRIGVARV